VGGSGAGPAPAYQIGITSHRPERHFQPGDLDEFEGELGKTPVKNASVQMGRGGWKGGWEPTFVTQYQGNGEAIKALARFGKKYNQDAVLVQRYVDKSDPLAQPQVGIEFGGKVSKCERASIEKVMGEQIGFGGWTWTRTPAGARKLVLTCVPQWNGEKNDHNAKCSELIEYLRGRGHGVKSNTRHVAVTVMDGSNYDAFASGEAKALNMAHLGAGG
jgi:hypothetical protein